MPRLSSQYLSRPRLLALLDSAAVGQLVVVCAPAGYGKTLLLADWTSRRPERTAWLTLDEDDNDDRRFWAAVLAAVGTCRAVPADSALHSLPLPHAPSSDPAFLPRLLDAVQAMGRPVTLVLDDVHELTAPAPLHGLAALVRNRPPNLQLVLASRLDPPLRLSRLRLAGELCELRAPQLALTLAETEVVFAAAQVELTPAQIKVLHEQTDGWAAALRLAAVSLREAADPEPFLADLVGNGQAISDYLVGEILSRLSPDVIGVLTAVSVCDEVTAALAVAVSGNAAAGEVLAALELSTSLVVSYGAGRQWFRVHPLLRAQLYAALRRQRPDLLTVRHERAVRWHAEAEDPAAALRHAVRARDREVVVGALRMCGAALVTSGHHVAVCAALDTVGALDDDPLLLLVGALAHLELGSLDAADRLLARVDACWPDDPGAELAALRTAAEGRRSSWHGPAGDGGATLPADATPPRRDAPGGGGLVQEAANLTVEAVDRAAREGNGDRATRATVRHAMITGMLGDIRRMLVLVEEAERRAPPEAWRGTVSAANALFARAYAALVQAQPAQCLLWTSEVEETVKALPAASRGELATIVPALDAVRAAARFDLGEQRAALDAMRTARVHGQQTAAQTPAQTPALDGPMLGIVALLEHDAATRLRLDVHAHTVLEWTRGHLGENGDVLLMRARGATSDTAARAHLQPLLEEKVAPAVPWTLIEGWLLECVLALRAGNRHHARHAMARALAASAATGVLRPLACAPAEVADLLTRQLGNLGEAEPLARDVLAIRAARSRGAAEAGGRAAPLTEREQAVVNLLPTLLSLEEIADALDITVNTVKTHVGGVYRKLGVHSRRDAVAAAHLAGLITAGAQAREGG